LNTRKIEKEFELNPVLRLKPLETQLATGFDGPQSRWAARVSRPGCASGPHKAKAGAVDLALVRWRG
jgi:hypothetical protein